MKQTAFIFGRTPHLSLLELQSFYPKAAPLIEGVSIVSEDVDSQKMIHLLGGTVKIVDIVSKMPELDTDLLFSELVTHVQDRHITFGISAYGRAHVTPVVLTTCKKLLSARGISARYVETKQNETLSSVVISK
ncbi:MAG: hypothetical protein AAB960_00495, partial [Patescibacteria group bacterium]